jgi:hypothetical protein
MFGVPLWAIIFVSVLALLIVAFIATIWMSHPQFKADLALVILASATWLALASILDLFFDIDQWLRDRSSSQRNVVYGFYCAVFLPLRPKFRSWFERWYDERRSRNRG